MNEITHTSIIKLNLINNMKTWLSNITNYVGFRKHGEEYQQAILRLIIVSGATLFVWLSIKNITPALHFLIVFYPAVALVRKEVW